MAQGGLVYGVEDRPPWQVMVLSGFQHVAILTVVGMVAPILVADRAGADQATRETVVGVALMAMALGTLIQCGRWRAVGSGFLVPAITTSAYLPASLKAADVGGLSLVFGMTIFAGFCVVLLSFLLRRLRPYLPTEIAGLAVTVIGIILGTLGFRLVFTEGGGAPPADVPLPGGSVGLLVLAITVGLTLWGSWKPKMFAALIGFLTGCAAAGVLDMLVLPDWMLDPRAWVRPPLPFGYVPTFDPSLIPDFLVAAIACSLRAMGDITTCQRVNDPGWKRQDIRSIQRGVLADGLSTMAAGCLNTVGLNTSSSSIGVSVGSGVTSRRVAIAIAIILMVLALAPRPRAFLAGIPLQVAGGVLLFSACFIIMNGVQILMSRMMDARKTIVVGLSLVFGLSYNLFPQAYAELPPVLRSLFGSDLVVAMVTAILLNLLFRIGVVRRARFTLSGRDDHDTPYTVMEAKGSEWGARREVVARVVAALVEFREQAGDLLAAGGEAAVDVRYDEFAIDVDIRYRGRAPVAVESGGGDVSLRDLDPEDAVARAQAILLLRLADRMKVERRGEDVRLRLHFEH